MNKYNMTFIKDGVETLKTVEAQDEGTAIALITRGEKVAESDITNIESDEVKNEVLSHIEVETNEPINELSTEEVKSEEEIA
jgi:hypothetical protein